MGIEDRHKELKQNASPIGKADVERNEQESEDFINLNVLHVVRCALPRILTTKSEKEYSYKNFIIIPKEKMSENPEHELFKKRLMQLWEYVKYSVLAYLRKRGKPLTRKKSEEEKERERKKEERKLKRKNKFRNYI